MKLTTLKPRLQTAHQPKRNWGQGRGGRAWVKLKNQILLRDNYTCQHCGRIGGQLELDHIINKARGGDDSPSNLQILCKECHQKKTQAESMVGGVLKISKW